MHRPAWLTVLLLPTAAALGQAAPVSFWVQDYELARSQARDRKVDLLMLFMGPVDEGANAKLEAEVLSKPEFRAGAGKLFVLARFDYPKDPAKVPEVLRKQNAWLLTKYRESRLPVVWLTDGMGVAYAKTGYAPGGAKAFVALLDGKRQANLKATAALQRAAGCRGIERATALAEAFRNLDDDIVAANHYREMLEIIAIDADGKAGLKAEFDAIARDAAAKPFLLRMQDAMGALVEQQNWPELDAQIEKARAQHQDERWAGQYLMYLQGVRKLAGDQDCAAALGLFTAALAMAPRSELAPQIERQRQEAAAAVEKQQRAAPASSKGGTPPKKK
jgi:hypothetical protein